MEKIKTWVLYCAEYPGGMIYRTRQDALEDASQIRENGDRSYVRVKYFMPDVLNSIPEAD